MTKYKVEKDSIHQAIVIAQNIMRNNSNKKVNWNDVKAINGFIMKASNSSTRAKITLRDCEKIINIAKQY